MDLPDRTNGETSPRSGTVPVPRRLDLRRTDDGVVDLEALERSVTPALMTDWVRGQLRGDHPLWPTDPHELPEPERVFLDLWKSCPPQSNTRHALDAACGVVLGEAWAEDAQQWHRDLLDLVRVIRPAPCRLLLRRVVERADFTARQIEMNLDREWLRAGAAYRWEPAPVIAAWKKLLGRERYVVIAYQALAQDLELGIWYLPTLHHAVDEQFRAFVLGQALRFLLRHEDQLLYARLRRREGHLSVHGGLCELIDAALQELDRPPVFAHPSTPGTRTPQQHAARSEGDAESKLAGLAGVKAAA